MHLIAPLAAGIAGAGNGRAKVCLRGTETLANVYADFYGTVLAQPANGLELDSNGGFVVYVDRLVDVIVTDDSGDAVRTWTDGVESTNVEYVGNAFTGTDYDSGATGVLKPVTLFEILERWLASAGSTNWEVDIGGVPTGIRDALGVLIGLYVNVKSPQYGAVGDGVTDDGTAINAALTAASLNGATVFFPAGTYVTSETLVLNRNVTMLAGGDVVIVKTGASAVVSCPQDGLMVIDGLELRQQGAATGAVVLGSTDFQDIRIYRSVLGNGAGSTQGNAVDVQGVACSVVLREVEIWIYGLTNRAVIMGGSGVLRWDVGAIRRPASRSDASTQVRATEMYISGVTGGAAATDEIIIEFFGTGAGVRGAVTLCTFQRSGSNVFYAIGIVNGNHAATRVQEALNSFTGTWASGKLLGFQANTNNPQITAASRDGAIALITDNSTPLTVYGDIFGETVITRTTNTAQQLTASVGAPGAIWTIVIFNNSGGVLGATSFGTGFVAGTPNLSSLPNGGLAVFQFRAVVVGGAGSWVPTSAVITL